MTDKQDILTTLDCQEAIQTKVCSECKKEKSLTDFSKRSARKSGWTSSCKVCRNIRTQKWTADNLAKRQEYYKNYDNEHKEKRCLQAQQRRMANPEKAKKINQRAYYKDVVKSRLRINNWKKNNPKKVKTTYNKGYFKKLQYHKNKLKTDIQYKLRANLRRRLNLILRKTTKIGSAVEDLGCTVKELKDYIEKQFVEGMTWDNWGNGLNNWSLDHIIPLSYFDLTDRFQFLLANNYKNLQPVNHAINCSKQNDLPENLQNLLTTLKESVLTIRS